jgi:hypothetical protein
VMDPLEPLFVEDKARLDPPRRAGPMEFDYRGHRTDFRLTGIAVLPFGIETDTAYSFDRRDYSNVTAEIGRKRVDNRHSVEIDLRRTLFSNFEVTLGYELLVAGSNVPSARYTHNILSLTLGFSY